MWTEETRRRHDRSGLRYSHDLTDEEWAEVEPLIPPAKPGGNMHAADIQDRDGGAMLMATLFGLYPFLLKLYADSGYQGPVFQKAMKTIMAQVQVEIVKRSDQVKGFIVLPKRWVVERTISCLNR